MARRRKLPVIFPEWHTRAACKGVPGWVFSNDREPLRDGRPRPEYDEAKAKAYCARCEVRDQCRDEAIAMGERYVIRGGLNPDELAAERRARRTRVTAA